MSRIPVQLAFGDRWLRELAWLHAKDGPEYARDPDLDVIASPIDLVVGRRNVLWRVPDEPWLPFLDRWCLALDDIARGASKRIVSLEASPWHIAMHRIGADELSLSVFQYASTAEVELGDVRLPIGAVQDATLHAIDTAAAVTPIPAAARERLGARLHALRERAATPIAQRQGAALDATRPALVVETTSAGHGTLRTQLDPAFRGLFAYDGAPALDRHAMLAPGVITWTDASGAVLDVDATPLHVWESLVDGLVVWTKHAPHDGGLETLDAGTLQLALVRGANRATAAAGLAEAVSMDADALVTLVASHVADLLGALVVRVPPLDHHAFLKELRRAATELVSMPIAPSSTVARMHPARLPTTASDEMARTTLGFPASSVRRIRFARDWSERVSLDAVRSWTLGPDGDWIGVDEGQVTRLARQTGEPVWRASTPRRTTWMARVGHDVFAADDAGMLHALAPESGAIRWRLGLDADEPVPRRGAPLPSRGAVLLLQETVLALDADTGHVRWSWRPGRGHTATRLVVVGSTVCVALSTGRVVGLRIADGRTAWSWASAEPSLRLAACSGLLAVWSRGPVNAATTLQWIEPDGGTLVARAVAPGAAHRWSASASGVALLIGGVGGDTLVLGDASTGRWATHPLQARTIGVVHEEGMTAILTGASVIGVDASGRTRWQVPLPRDTRDPRLADTCAAPGVVVVRDDQRVAFLEAWSGALLGEAPAFWEQASRLHVGEDGGWLLVESGPDRTAWLHGVPAVGMLAALDGGRRDR